MKVNVWRSRAALGLVGMVALAWACAEKTPPPAAPAPEPEPCKELEKLPVVVDGASDLNAGPDGQPLPTIVRVYQLKGTGRLETASLDQLIRSGPEILGEDVVDSREFTLNPRARFFPDMRRDSAATHVAVVGLVRRPSGNSWWAVATLPASDPFHCHRRAERTPWLQFFLQGYQVAYVP